MTSMFYDVPPFLGITFSIAIVDIGTMIDAIIIPTSASVMCSTFRHLPILV